MHDVCGTTTLGQAETCLTPHMSTVTEKLRERKTRLTDELANVTEALNALEANPEIERVLNLVSKAGRLRR